MRGSLRRDRMIGATVTSGFAWFAAWVPLSLGLGLFFGPPGVSLIEFAVLVAASVWLVWHKPLVAAGWVRILAKNVRLCPAWPFIFSGSDSLFTVFALRAFSFRRPPTTRFGSAPPRPSQK